MNIKIENYNGIESLDYNLEEGKVNFLEFQALEKAV